MAKTKLNRSVIEYCAKISTLGHGNSRHAIDLLTVVAEFYQNKQQEKEERVSDVVM